MGGTKIKRRENTDKTHSLQRNENSLKYALHTRVYTHTYTHKHANTHTHFCFYTLIILDFIISNEKHPEQMQIVVVGLLRTV